MKKIISIILIIAMTFSLFGCAQTNENNDIAEFKDQIGPYRLTEREEFLLDAYGLISSSQIVVYNAPEKATSLNLNVKTFENKEWTEKNAGSISVQNGSKSVKSITMKRLDDYAIDFKLSAGLKTEYTVEKPDFTRFGSSHAYMTDFVDIELNKEIPIAIMVYTSGTTMQSFVVEDYSDLSRFEEYDYVQIVTVEFGDGK